MMYADDVHLPTVDDGAEIGLGEAIDVNGIDAASPPASAGGRSPA